MSINVSPSPPIQWNLFEFSSHSPCFVTRLSHDLEYFHGCAFVSVSQCFRTKAFFVQDKRIIERLVFLLHCNVPNSVQL